MILKFVTFGSIESRDINCLDTSNMIFSEQIIAKFYDAYVHHSARVS